MANLIALILLGLVAGNYSASVISSKNDAALIAVMDKARVGLDKLLDTAESTAQSTREKTFANLKRIRAQYAENFGDVKTQLASAADKLKDSFASNYKIITSTLERNNNNIREQVEPNFVRGLESFQHSFDQLIVKLPTLKGHFDKTVAELKSRAGEVFAKNDEELKSLKDQLETEFQAGLKDLEV